MCIFLQLNEKRQAERDKQKAKHAAELKAKEALKSIPPNEYFKRLMADKYSKFDDTVRIHFIVHSYHIAHHIIKKLLNELF